MPSIRWMFRRIFTIPLLLYRAIISPALPRTCIYDPTCSRYGIQAIMKHGPVKGFILGIMRVFRCIGHFYTGGRDEVPDLFSFKAAAGKYREFLKKKGKGL